MSEVTVMTQTRTVTPNGNVRYKTRPATPSEIAKAFWSLWWGANSKPTVDQIEAVQTACKVVEELTGAPDETE